MAQGLYEYTRSISWLDVVKGDYTMLCVSCVLA